MDQTLHDGFPFGVTARRRTWEQLPARIRDRVAEHCGGPVVSTRSMTGGFTPGFASVLALADGRRAFVKAAGRVDDERQGWPISHSYREEARIRSALPVDLPAPPLLWSYDDGDWIVNGFEYVDGRHPRRPWHPAELDLVVAMLTQLASRLETAPSGLELPDASEDFSATDVDNRVAQVRARDGDSTELVQVAALAREFPERAAGRSIVHFDVRDDNILLTDDHAALLCDWNWPRLGAPWIDLVSLLFSVHADGLDADAILADDPLTRDVDPRSIDSFLATCWLFFTTAAEQSVPEFSPHLREFQRIQGDWVRSWLRDRASI